MRPDFIGIDVGRHELKADNGRRRLHFRSAVGEARDRRLVEDLNYDVEVDGRRYFVADLAEESRYRREMATESKIHQETVILFLTAAALTAQGADEMVITTGLPVYQHTPDTKKDLAQLLQGRHVVKVSDHRPVNLTIGDVGIVAEGAGAYWNEVLDDEGKVKNTWSFGRLTRVLDLGSRTINYCTIKPGGRYADVESGTLCYGMIDLDNAEDGDTDQGREAFARRIVADMSKKWTAYNTAKDLVLIAGGGAIRLGQQFKKHFVLSTVADDPVFANAAGFRKMGVARWHRKEG